MELPANSQLRPDKRQAHTWLEMEPTGIHIQQTKYPQSGDYPKLEKSSRDIPISLKKPIVNNFDCYSHLPQSLQKIIHSSKEIFKYRSPNTLIISTYEIIKFAIYHNFQFK